MQLGWCYILVLNEYGEPLGSISPLVRQVSWTKGVQQRFTQFSSAEDVRKRTGNVEFSECSMFSICLMSSVN